MADKRKLTADPDRNWLTNYVGENFPKISAISQLIGAPTSTNPLEGIQFVADLTGVPGLINAATGNPMNLPNEEVQAAMLPVIGGLGKYLTEKTILKNAHKLNPFSFKPKPEAYYRGIGKGGYEDALNSKLFRQYGFDSGVPKHKSVWYAEGVPGFERAKTYSKEFIAEVPSNAFPAASLDKFGGSPGRQTRATLEHIPVEKGRILQKHWLKGYEDVTPHFKYGGLMKNKYFGNNLGEFMPRLYFLGSDLSFTDFMKNNPQGIAGVGASATQQKSDTLGSATQIASTAGNMLLPGAGTALSAVSGITGSLVDKFDKPGGSKFGAIMKGAPLGPVGIGLALMDYNKNKRAEQSAINRASQQAYAQGTQGVDSGMHTYTAAHGGFISPITEFNGGGTHEENPLGGIPQGYNRDNGAPNLVESRETKSNIKNIYSDHPEAKPTKNYIFSDRGVLEDPKAFGLGGNLAGKTFAAAHKKLSALADERPFDGLTNNTLAINTTRLKAANDAMIAEKDFEASNPADKISHYNQKDRLGSRSIFKYGGFIFKDF